MAAFGGALIVEEGDLEERELAFNGLFRRFDRSVDLSIYSRVPQTARKESLFRRTHRSSSSPLS